MITRRTFGVGLAASTLAGGSIAQERRPEVAKILVPFSVGGTMDLIARLMAEQVRGEVADVVVVENKSGAAGRIAIEALRLATPDGSTLMIHAGGAQTLYPHTMKQLGYDPFGEFVPLTVTNRLEFCLAVGPGTPQGVRTLSDYLDWIRGDPKRAAYATPGAGTPLHFLPMLLGKGRSIQMLPSHYRGTGAFFPDLLGGHVPAASSPLHDVLQQMPTGKLRILATSGGSRSRFTPDVPTYAEQGFPQLTSSDWYAIYVSAKVPQAIQERIGASLRKALGTPSVASAFARAFIEPTPTTQVEAMQMARAGFAQWERVVRELGYQPE